MGTLCQHAGVFSAQGHSAALPGTLGSCLHPLCPWLLTWAQKDMSSPWEAAGTCSGGGDKVEAVSPRSESPPGLIPHFLSPLHVPLEGTPVNRIPIMAKQVLDLYTLYRLVTDKGGLVEVINKKIWREITKGLNLPTSITSAAFTLRTQ